MPLRAVGEGRTNGEQRRGGRGVAQRCKRLEWGREEERPEELLQAWEPLRERDSIISIWATVQHPLQPERATRVHSA